jgi:hypothetical protein
MIFLKKKFPNPDSKSFTYFYKIRFNDEKATVIENAHRKSDFTDPIGIVNKEFVALIDKIPKTKDYKDPIKEVKR